MERPASRTTPDLMDEMAARFQDRPYLADPGHRLTYAEFRDEVRRHAKGLHTLGLRKGGRLAILMGNRVEWVVAYFAAMTLGAEVVALNTWATAREIAYQLGHGSVEYLVFEPRFRDRDLMALLEEAAGEPGLDPPPRYVVVDHGPADAIRFADLPALGAAVGDDVIDTAQRAIDPGDTACILYTSGSTALPKGVPLYHSGMIDNMWGIGERLRLTESDRLWLGVGLFWSYACVNALFALTTHGGSIVLQHHFEPGEALRLIEDERCTVFYGVPAMVRPMWEHPDRPKRDLSSLRAGTTIGTPAQVQMAVDLGVAEISNVYGLTEAYGNSCVIPANEPLERRLVSSGPPLEGCEIRIANPDTGVALPAGEPGEIRVRGHVMKGYLGDKGRTKEVFDADGFLGTGDLGVLDAAGYLTYQGRLKEMIKTGGINVAPAEVEAVLSGHHGIDQVYVTGVPDERLDEAVAAVVVLEADAAVTEDDLTDHCRDLLAAYKIPRRYRFIAAEDLPLTTTGKLQRDRLAALFG